MLDYVPTFLNQASTTQLDRSRKKLDRPTEEYYPNNWKETTERLRAQIKIKNDKCVG